MTWCACTVAGAVKGCKNGGGVSAVSAKECGSVLSFGRHSVKPRRIRLLMGLHPLVRKRSVRRPHGDSMPLLSYTQPLDRATVQNVR